MKDLDISKVYLAAISGRDAFRNEIDKRRVTSKQPKPKPNRPKWTDKSPFGKSFEEKVRNSWENKKNSKKN